MIQYTSNMKNVFTFIVILKMQTKGVKKKEKYLIIKYYLFP